MVRVREDVGTTQDTHGQADTLHGLGQQRYVPMSVLTLPALRVAEVNPRIGPQVDIHPKGVDGFTQPAA